jgi:histidinol-phosphate aminotransferase
VALLGPGDQCLTLAPCFGEYRRAVEVAGADCLEIRAQPPDFCWKPAQIEQALAQAPAMCLLANPANPMGTALPASVLRHLSQAFPETRFVIDEAFVAFAPSGTSLLDDGSPPSNTLIVRSLTKELALPGLRMGYVVAREEIANSLGGILPPWPLSAPALAAAVAGMADTEHVNGGARLARREMREIAEALAAAGAAPLPTSANYVLAHAPGAVTALQEQGIAVRDCDSFGLPEHIRMAAPTQEQFQLVLDAIGGLKVTPLA